MRYIKGQIAKWHKMHTVLGKHLCIQLLNVLNLLFFSSLSLCCFVVIKNTFKGSDVSQDTGRMYHKTLVDVRKL